MRPNYREAKRRRRMRQLLLAALAIGAASAAAAVCRGQCAGGVCPPPPGWHSAPPSTPSAVSVAVSAQVRGAVCRVVNEVQGGASLGTGTLVHTDGGVGYLLTCEHLFSDGVGRVSVRFGNSAQRPAELFARDAVNDLALLRVTNPAGRSLSTSNSVQRDWLTTVGLGSSGNLRAIRGRVLGQTAQRGSQFASVIIQGAVRQGDSGGPVLNAQDQVVGVVWGSRANSAYVMVGEPVQRILAMIPPPSQQQPTRPGPPTEGPAQTPLTCPCDGNCVQPEDLAGLARQSDLERLVEQISDTCEQSHGALQGQIVALSKQAGNRTNPGEGPLDAVRLILTGLGVGGPIGAALLVARLLLPRRRGTRRGSGGPREGGFR